MTDQIAVIRDLREALETSIFDAKEAMRSFVAGEFPDLLQAAFYLEARKELVHVAPEGRRHRDVERAETLAKDAVERDPSLARFLEISRPSPSPSLSP